LLYLTYLGLTIEAGLTPLKEALAISSELISHYGMDPSFGRQILQEIRSLPSLDHTLGTVETKNVLGELWKKEIRTICVFGLAEVAEAAAEVPEAAEETTTKTKSTLAAVADLEKLRQEALRDGEDGKGFAKEVEDGVRRKVEERARLEEVVKEQGLVDSLESLRGADVAKKIGFVKALIDAQLSMETIRGCFEIVLRPDESSSQESEVLYDLWKIFAKYVQKNIQNAKTRSWLLLRASRELPSDLPLAQQYLDSTFASFTPEDLQSSTVHTQAYNTLLTRFSQDTLSQLKLGHSYLSHLINYTVRVYGKEGFDDGLEAVIMEVVKIGEGIGGRKDLGYEERKWIEKVYKDYLALVHYLPSTLTDRQIAVDICERLVKISGNEAANWIEYIRIIEKYADIALGREQTRQIYKRAILFCKGDISILSQQYLSWERLFGDGQKGIEEAEEIIRKAKEGKGDSRIEVNKTMGERAHGKQEHQPQVKNKNMKELYSQGESQNKTVFIKGLPLYYTRADIEEILPNPDKIVDIRLIPAPSKGYSIAYIDYPSPSDATLALKADRKHLDGRTLFVALSSPPASTPSTLFINNLPFGIDEKTLRLGIKFCVNDVLGIRIHRSYAFVQFISEDKMRKHLKILKNNYMIGGRRIEAKIARDNNNNGGGRGEDRKNSNSIRGREEEEEGSMLGKREKLSDVSAENNEHEDEEEPSLPIAKPKAETNTEAPHLAPFPPKPTPALPPQPTPKPRSNKDFRNLFKL